MTDDMKIDPTRAQSLITNIATVRERIASVAAGRNVRHSTCPGHYMHVMASCDTR